MGPVRGDFEEPSASHGQLLILPRNLIHARLLYHVPEPLSLLLVRPLTVHQAEQQKPCDVNLPTHVIHFEISFLFLHCGLLSFQLCGFKTGTWLTPALFELGWRLYESFGCYDMGNIRVWAH